MQSNKAKIAVIGGGIAGASVALYLSQFDLEITLFEKEPSLVNGPPMCHLHAGGNLYREIDNKQCIKLLKQSIELLRFYPYAIDFRPTLLVTPKDDPHPADALLDRLKMLQKEYEKLIEADPKNKVLGESSEYYKLYTKEKLISLRQKEIKKKPLTLDDWLIPLAKELDLQKIKFPIIMVQEYGLNVFRIAASSSLLLEKQKNVDLKRKTFIEAIEKDQDSFVINGQKFDYLINAAGFRSGFIDDLLGLKRERLVEFKAAYVSRWEQSSKLWPEVIFYGERGTPRGMAQFTPYPNGYFQLHGMTQDITLFEDGLAKNRPNSSEAKLPSKFIQKIESGWQSDAVKKRTEAAIRYLSQFIPSFKDAKVASKPLFGAQQIPGDDITLRASEVSFDTQRYARCEIVKASSIVTMAEAIAQKLIDLKLIDKEKFEKKDFSKTIKSEDITVYAKKLCRERNYPEDLALVNNGI